MRKELCAIVAITVIMLALAVMFPPWATMIQGNGYPRIDFRWIGSPPPPIDQWGYRIDIGRLLIRIVIVLTFTVVTGICLIWCYGKLGKERKSNANNS